MCHVFCALSDFCVLHLLFFKYSHKKVPMNGLTLLQLYRNMLLIRRFEEAAEKAYTERKIGGFLHLYIGQEAVGTGVIAKLESHDHVISAYRSHAHYLLRGGTAREGMAELLGKQTGCSGGRGGSMHFFAADKNFHGGHGIVGAHVPVATGLAFATKYRGEDAVTVCFLGDGAVSIGPFHEGLCLAALWKLPVLFVVENNLYAMGTPLSRTLVTEDASIRALGYPMARATVEGTDVVECYNSAAQAIDYVRSESQPFLLEFKTYRYKGHSMADPAKYRTKEELNTWKQRDPINIAQVRVRSNFPELTAKLSDIEQSVDDEILDAVKFAEESPEPPLEEVGYYTYV